MRRLTVRGFAALLAVACVVILPGSADVHQPAIRAPEQSQPSRPENPAARKIPDAQVVDQDGKSLSFYRDLQNFGAHLAGYTVSKNKFHQSVQPPAGQRFFSTTAPRTPERWCTNWDTL